MTLNIKLQSSLIINLGEATRITVSPPRRVCYLAIFMRKIDKTAFSHQKGPNSVFTLIETKIIGKFFDRFRTYTLDILQIVSRPKRRLGNICRISVFDDISGPGRPDSRKPNKTRDIGGIGIYSALQDSRVSRIG